MAATLEAADAWLWEARQRTDVILVDPPRCGLDAETLALVARFDHVLYVSCNPSALRANLDAALGATHEVVRRDLRRKLAREQAERGERGPHHEPAVQRPRGRPIRLSSRV